MADRRYYDSFTVGSIRLENSELGVPLARSLGRIGDKSGLPTLQTLLIEGKPEVRREAAFALGLIADPQSARHLQTAVADSDIETAVWAIAGLADQQGELVRVVKALEWLSPAARWERLSPYLFRFPAVQILPVARDGLEIQNTRVQAMVIFALARNPQLEAAEVLRAQIGNRDPWVQGWVARALGQVGDRDDLMALKRLLGHEQAAPVIQSLRAAHRLIGSGMAPAPDDWIPELLKLIEDPRPGVALTAMESAAAWLLDDDLGAALQQLAERGRPREQEVALEALAVAGDPRARDKATRLAVSSLERQRALAAAVAGRLGDDELSQFLILDESALVREAALAGILEPGGALAAKAAIESLEDPDPGVRALVMEWLIDNPVVPADLVSRAILGPGARDVFELRLFGTRALLSRALDEPLERGLVIENLESLAEVGEYPARREAAAALVELGRPEPSIGPAGSRKTTKTYIQMVLQTNEIQLVEIETRHGNLRIALACAEARATCLNFLQLTDQKFYDGQVFHRVVPDFVVQTGDPRGDGWGGPGYTIRDELNRQPFDRGVIGMASSGPDTAGSQFFITLSRQPHLDGRYTAFGKVVGGDEVLDRLEQGDRLERLRVVR
jgi:cyclophilin family peptidyl-prolyl cis-trans isomerase/HEAT repeat protein